MSLTCAKDFLEASIYFASQHVFTIRQGLVNIYVVIGIAMYIAYRLVLLDFARTRY